MGYIDGKWVPLIMITVIDICAGTVNALIKKVLDGGINPMVIATYRLGISTLFLLPIAYFWERKTRPKLTISILCQLFISALFGASLMQYFYLLGLSYTNATLGSAFWGIMPALTFIMALIFGFEKLNMKTKVGYGVVLGTMISLGGALLLTMYQGIPLSKLHAQATSSNVHAGHENWIKGCVLLFTGVTLFSSWMLIQAKINVNYPCPYSSTVMLSVFGTFQCAILSLFKTRHVDEWILRDKLTIITVIVAGVVVQGICTVGISWCIKQRGPVFTSAFSPVLLMSATLTDILFLHRTIYLGSVIGSLVVVIGLYVFLWSKSKQIVDCKTMKLPTNTVEEEEGHTNVNKGQFLAMPMTP
uniref:WAT1-related protein n=1 Tax=Noccaea caerulescens TaxID=107243 RepID=A0A1J3JSX8_NOCCA